MEGSCITTPFPTAGPSPGSGGDENRVDLAEEDRELFCGTEDV